MFNLSSRTLKGEVSADTNIFEICEMKKRQELQKPKCGWWKDHKPNWVIGRITQQSGRIKSLDSLPVFFTQWHQLHSNFSHWTSQHVPGLCAWIERQSHFLGWMPSSPAIHIKLTPITCLPRSRIFSSPDLFPTDKNNAGYLLNTFSTEPTNPYHPLELRGGQARWWYNNL
jgi:hypothetical protein